MLIIHFTFFLSLSPSSSSISLSLSPFISFSSVSPSLSPSLSVAILPTLALALHFSLSLSPPPSLCLSPSLLLSLPPSLSPPPHAVRQVIYSLNMKNEEQESALQTLTYAHQEELHRIVMETCHEGEGSVLRTRLLELQESLDQQQRVGAQVSGEIFTYIVT